MVAAGQGLVREHGGPGSWTFVHALTRDAVLLTLTGSHRARRHARLAQALEASPSVRALVGPDELTAELARHWTNAGPGHADQAWPAARTAADQARGLSAHLEAARLRREAVDAQRRSSRPVAQERYALLLDLAQDAAFAAVWPEVVRACTEAAALARAAADAAQVASAAAGITRYALWLPHEWGVVNEDLVDDLRWALSALPSEDGAARCQVLLALAVELYYDRGAVAEREALVRSGLATARRVGDPALLWWACRAAWLATWVPEQTEDQVRVAEEALAAAERAGDPAAEAVAALALATGRMELGGPEGWQALAERADALARRHRLPYVVMARHLVETNLATLRGDPEGLERSTRLYRDAEQDIAVPGPELDGADLLLAMVWDERLAELGHLVGEHEVDPMLWPVEHMVLARTGRLDELAARLARRPLRDLAGTWASTWTWCWEAEAAAAVGAADRAARLLDLLRPFAGRMAVGGIAFVQGPVDGYLALAAVAAGHRTEAAAHADRADALAEAWALSRYRVWLAARRAALGF